MRIAPTRDDLIELTAGWQGDRFDDGRPRVPDDVLARIRDATTEQAWSVLLEAGFARQFAGGWRRTRPERVLVGRAVTAQFLPHRPDLDAAVVGAGAREGRVPGDKQNSWIIDTLVRDDVMVVDIFGKITDGTVVGDNLGTAVIARTGAGAVINGGVRDLDGLVRLEQGTIYYRDTDPTPIRNVTLAGLNLPIRIGEASVLPGDVVLGTLSGLIFVPPTLAERVADVAEDIATRDRFGKLRLAEGVYSSAEIDVSTWPDHIEEDFRQWKQARP